VTLAEAKVEAQIQARNAQGDRYVVRTMDGYVVVSRAPLLGEWYHVYPDGYVLRRG